MSKFVIEETFDTNTTLSTRSSVKQSSKTLPSINQTSNTLTLRPIKPTSISINIHDLPPPEQIFIPPSPKKKKFPTTISISFPKSKTVSQKTALIEENNLKNLQLLSALEKSSQIAQPLIPSVILNDLSKWERTYLDPSFKSNQSLQHFTRTGSFNSFSSFSSKQINQRAEPKPIPKALDSIPTMKKQKQNINRRGIVNDLQLNLSKTILSVNTVLMLSEQCDVNDLIVKHYTDFITDETINESLTLFLRNLKQRNYKPGPLPKDIDFDHPKNLIDLALGGGEYEKLCSLDNYRDYVQAKIKKENKQRQRLKELVIRLYRNELAITSLEQKRGIYIKKLLEIQTSLKEINKTNDERMGFMNETLGKMSMCYNRAMMTDDNKTQPMHIKKVINFIEAEQVNQTSVYNNEAIILQKSIKDTSFKINFIDNHSAKLQAENIQISKRIKESVLIQLDYYKSLLRKGIDNRREGLVWIVKRLLELNCGSIDITMFPKYLKPEAIKTIVSTAYMHIELAQTKLVHSHLKRKLRLVKDKVKGSFFERLRRDYGLSGRKAGNTANIGKVRTSIFGVSVSRDMNKDEVQNVNAEGLDNWEDNDDDHENDNFPKGRKRRSRSSISNIKTNLEEQFVDAFVRYLKSEIKTNFSKKRKVASPTKDYTLYLLDNIDSIYDIEGSGIEYDKREATEQLKELYLYQKKISEMEHKIISIKDDFNNSYKTKSKDDTGKLVIYDLNHSAVNGNGVIF